MASPWSSNQVTAARRLGNSSWRRTTACERQRSTEEVGLHLLGEGQAPRGEALSSLLRLAAGLQPFQAELAHRLQHAKAEFTLEAFLLPQALVDEEACR